MLKASQRGFTLIELVVVIVILGILAAFAVPRFMGLETEARVATVKSLGGTIRSAAAMAHGICVARNCPNGATVIAIGGQNVTFTFQYPNRATLPNTMEAPEGFTYTPANGRFTKNGSRTANCYVQYNVAANGVGPALQYQAGIISAVPPVVTEAQVDAALRAAC